MMRNLLVKAQSGKPAPSQMHAQLFQQLPLAGDAVQIAQQQDPQQHFRVNRRSACLAVAIAQFVAHKLEADVTINEA
jgi:hypothetical protein